MMPSDDQALDYLTGQRRGGVRPDAIGKKFDDTGQPLVDPGCTFIFHVDQTSDAYLVLTEAQNQLKAGPLADAFTYLPAPSYHMTIFDAFIESGRCRERVPSHLSVDATVAEISNDVAASIDGLHLATSFVAKPLGIFAGFSVAMTGASDAETTKLRTTRDKISDAVKIRRADHETYQFHITLAYLRRWLTPDEAQSVIDLSRSVGATLTTRVPRIEFGPVEFCTFDTMHRFDPQRFLKASDC